MIQKLHQTYSVICTSQLMPS